MTTCAKIAITCNILLVIYLYGNVYVICLLAENSFYFLMEVEKEF